MPALVDILDKEHRALNDATFSLRPRLAAITPDRLRDGPDALPRHRAVYGCDRKPAGRNLHILDADQELFRLRTQPELYEPWMVDLVDTQRTQMVEAMGHVFDWDCHTCRTAVLTVSLLDRCPNCGAR